MVASSNTASPPIVSAVLTDDRSGVSLVENSLETKNSEVWKTTPSLQITMGSLWQCCQENLRLQVLITS